MKKINNIDSQLKFLFKTIIDPKIKNFNKLEFGKSKNWDSLKHIQLIIGIEKKFFRKIKTSDFAKLNTFNKIKKYFSQ